MEAIEKNVLDLAKSLYETSPASKVNFSKGKVVNFDNITLENRDLVHAATVLLGAKCDAHDHSKPVNFAGSAAQADILRRMHKAEQERIKFAADKKRLLGMTPTGQAALKNAGQPANPNLSKREAEKARLMKLGGTLPKPYSPSAGNS